MWYLTFIDFDDMENQIGDARRKERRKLRAYGIADVAVARIQARDLWAELSNRVHRGWDGEAYPQWPELVWVEPLEF